MTKNLRELISKLCTYFADVGNLVSLFGLDIPSVSPAAGLPRTELKQKLPELEYKVDDYTQSFSVDSHCYL